MFVTSIKIFGGVLIATGVITLVAMAWLENPALGAMISVVVGFFSLAAANLLDA